MLTLLNLAAGDAVVPDKSDFRSDNEISVSVVGGSPPELRNSAPGLFWKAFSRKLRFTLGAEEKALLFLQRCIVPEQAICAVHSAGRLAGFTAIKSHGYGFIHPRLSDFYAAYGISGGAIRALIMSKLDYQPAKNEI
ncbi:hypothetical protein ABRZ24_01900 [Brenneria populi]|uniref:Uncharacterized protein n=1 Tax=Brenneria populi TaxID=1505588 RepID=A0ABU6JL30_9GAMM|nr:hypothetical protein [Brenneria populi Li et al. 2015]